MVLAADRTAETLDLSCAVLVEDYTRYSASLADNVAAVVAVVLRTAVVVVAERCSLSRDTADTSSHQHHQHSLAAAVSVDTLVASLFAALGLGICCFLAIYLLPSPLEERIENSVVVVVVVKVVDHPSPTEDIAAARAAAEDTTRKTKPAVVVAAALLLETQYSSSTTMLVEEASHRNGLSEVPADARVKENYYFANSSPSEAQKRDTQLLRMIPVEEQEPERYIVVADTLRCSSAVVVPDTETKGEVDSCSNSDLFFFFLCPFIFVRRVSNSWMVPKRFFEEKIFAKASESKAFKVQSALRFHHIPKKAEEREK